MSTHEACYLQERRLHEVHTGGLSSYSVINLVVAHLQAQGYMLETGGGPGVDKDLGNLLWGFFDRFGNLFDYHDQAVSISQVCPIPHLSEGETSCGVADRLSTTS